MEIGLCTKGTERRSRGVLIAVLALGAIAAATVSATTATAESSPGRPAPKPRGSAVGDYLSARVAQAGGDWEAAGARLASVLSRDPENAGLLRRAFQVDLANGDMEKALRAARSLAASGGASPLSTLLILAEDLKAGRLDAARKGLNRLPDDGVGSYLRPLVAAWVRVAEGDRTGGLAELEPKEGQPAGLAGLAQLQRALILDQAGSVAEAGPLYDAAVERGGPLRAVQLAAEFRQRQGEADRARALWRSYLERFPGSPVAEDALAAIGGAKPKRDVADAVDGLAEALYDMAAALYQERALDLALAYVRVSLHLRPRQPLAQLLAGEALLGRGRLEQALSAFRSVTGAPGVTWAARLRQSDVLRRLDQAEAAATLLQAMAAERKDRTDALLRLGDLWRSQEKDRQAEDAYDLAIKRVPSPGKGDWVLFYARALARDGLAKWEEAEADLLKALSLDGDQPQVLNHLGYSWADKGVRLPEALELIRRAVALKPDDGYIVDSLGWVAFKMGDYSTAIQQLERAVELRPLDPAINDHLGDAYWAVGRRVEARYQWSRAAQQATEPALREAATAKLKDGIALPKTAGTEPEPMAP